MFVHFNQSLKISALESLFPDIGQIFEWGAANELTQAENLTEGRQRGAGGPGSPAQPSPAQSW
jgi:hypothetical protein